jgi:hypothetical protein
VREASCLSTPGVLGSGPSSVVSVHHGLLRPHPPVSRAHRDFTALRLIHDAFAVRERLGCPRDLPYFRCRAVHACRRPYAGGSAPPSRFSSARRYQASSTYQRVATHKTRLCQQSSTGLNVSTPHRSLHATARAFAKPSWLATTRYYSPPRLRRYLVTPAFDATRRREALGARLDGRTGNLPSSGLSPDQSRQLVRLHDRRFNVRISARCTGLPVLDTQEKTCWSSNQAVWGCDGHGFARHWSEQGRLTQLRAHVSPSLQIGNG